MKTVILCVGFYGLGVFNCAVFAAVYLLHRPRYVAPTKRRKYRDAPVTEVEKPAEPMYMYGVTGLEE